MFSFASACQAQNLSSAKQTVDIFLNDWLVKKDIQKVQRNFDSNLFKSERLFSESCSDIEDKDRNNSRRLEQKTIKFFQDIAKNAQGKLLKEILVLGSAEQNLEDVKLLSSPANDKFILFKAEEKNTEINSNDFKMLEARFPSDGYVELGVLIRYKFPDGELVNFPVYMIWAKEHSSWKIIQFGMMCQ